MKSHETYHTSVVGLLIARRLDIKTMPAEVMAEAFIRACSHRGLGAAHCAEIIEQRLYAVHEANLAAACAAREA